MKYIWQHKNWPKLTWKSGSLLPLVSEARKAQGVLLAQVKSLGFKLEGEAEANILTEEAIKTSAIEGERLNPEAVRSSVARHLGLSSAGLTSQTRSVDGLVEVLLDATRNYNKPLTAARMKGWQAGFFPTGYSGFHKIRVGKWRGREPMRVVSGPAGREKIHYEAPPGEKVEKEMRQFFSWWSSSLKTEDGLLRAGLAHFYFVTIHPFEDGNGRIARALTDMALAQDEKLGTRYYSFSSQIMAEREEYYAVLEKCSKGNQDVTNWLAWFLGCYCRAVKGADKIISDVLAKAEFWQRHGKTEMNDRQKKVVNKLLSAGKGGFQGGLTTRKYVSMTKTSRATAFREMSELLDKSVLRQNPAKGRSASYNLNWSSSPHNSKE